MIAWFKRWSPILARVLSYDAAFAVFLLFVIYVSYGLFLPKMGFYWDDWETIYLARNNTISGYLNYFIFDRPQAIWTQILFVPLLGMNPLRWQIFGLLIRWLNAFLVYRALLPFWPQMKQQLRWAAFLVAVYPGFQQQALSVIYSRYLMLASLFLLSLWLMALAYRSSRWRVWFCLLSILLGLVQALTLEYFSSLELLRPILLYNLVRHDTPENRKALRQTIRSWFPYALIPIAFLVYRYGFLPTLLLEEPHPLVWIAEFAHTPVNAVLNFAQVLITNFVYVAFSVWTMQIGPLLLVARGNSDFLAWLVGLLLGALVAIYLGISNHDKNFDERPVQSWNLILVGVIGIFAGLLPILVLGREPLVGKWSDRLTLPAMYGCALLMVGLISYGLANHWIKAISIGLLVAMAVTGHVQTTRNFRYDWKDLTEYMWQIVWRVPAAQNGTVFVSPELPFYSQAGYSMGLAIDLIYGSGEDPANPKYWWEEAENFDLASKNPAYNFRLRNIGFDASFDQAVFLETGRSGSCMHVMDEFYLGSALMAEDTQTALAMQKYANTKHILPSNPGTSLPVEIFGDEPAHTWCYYFQKADLARQQGNWQEVITLYEEAFQHGYRAKNGAEYLPLIEALLQTAQFSSAVDKTITASELTLYNNNPGLCRTWENYSESVEGLSQSEQSVFRAQKQKVDSKLACKLE